MGLLSERTITGIAISPACDVSNFKTETLTYLPIVPVAKYFSTIGFLPELRREILDRYKAADVDPQFKWPEPGYLPPSTIEMEREMERIEGYVTLKARSGSALEHLHRLLAGFRVALACSSASLEEANIADVARLYGTQWEKMKLRMIGNSYRTDVHFLPADGQNLSFPGIKAHSLVLFRYPITVPVEILAAAQSCSPALWTDKMQSYESVSAAAVHFSATYPMKVLTLRSAFLVDLLGRFTALYSRTGSPDFSKAAMDKFSRELDA